MAQNQADNKTYDNGAQITMKLGNTTINVAASRKEYYERCGYALVKATSFEKSEGDQ